MRSQGLLNDAGSGGRKWLKKSRPAMRTLTAGNSVVGEINAYY